MVSPCAPPSSALPRMVSVMPGTWKVMVTLSLRATTSALAEIGLAQHVARPHRAARGEADRLFRGGDDVGGELRLRAPHDGDVGGAHDLAGRERARQHGGLEGLGIGAGEAQRGCACPAARTARRSGRCADRTSCARCRRSLPGSMWMVRASLSKVSVRLLASVLRCRPASACVMRVSMSFGRDRGARARDHDLGQTAGFEIDDLVRQHRLDDALDRDAAGLAEIGRAEDRDIGGGAGVLHEIADAHDLADHRDRRLERRAGDALRQRRVARRSGRRTIRRRRHLARRRFAPRRGG